MKKLTALLLGAAMVLSLAACGGTASSSEAASSSEGASSEAASSEATSEAAATEVTTVEPGKLIMTTNAAFPPYEMTTDDGDYEGIDVEIAGAIADKLGLELVIDNKDFDAALLAVQGGEAADMVMAGVTVTDERKAVMDFTDSYASGVQVVIVPEDSDIASIDDMQGKMIGVQRGTTGDLYCSDTVENGGFGAENVTPYPDGLTAVQALMNGQVDCVVIDNAPAQEFVTANPGLKILDTEYANEDYAIGVAKGNTQLLDALNTAIAELKADGTIQSILDKYISAE
ncbi:transporter substrate-binding domain-containing protein [uncultured Subdoligranulum sp.]|uniref:transporter substrate-binding domain-containing protein n=1 Tax=uncultured Subdoligranulum sp. TaxID=512298 RepID=UPI00261FB0B6|nr:transporter substrate-binding domain-containing protein [uncultured Subdoligranulum sp.]